MHENPEKSLANYVVLADMVSNVANNAFGIKISPETHSHFQTLGYALRKVDNEIDGNPSIDSRHNFESNFLRFLSGSDPELPSGGQEAVTSIQNLREVLTQLDNERSSSFLRNLSMLVKVTEHIKETTEVRELSTLTRLEGQIVASMFLSLIPESDLKPARRKEFTHWFKRIGRFGNMLDTLKDMPSDYENGEIRVKPWLNNRRLIARDTLNCGVSLARSILLSGKPVTIYDGVVNHPSYIK